MRICLLRILYVGGVAMKNKRALSFAISAIMLILVFSSPFISCASFFVDDGDIVSCPGNTRIYVEESKYNYAWLDSVILRDGADSVAPLTVYPVCDDPYSHTYQEFVKECNSYMLLSKDSDNTVENSIMDMLKTVYYLLVASGKITDTNPDMRAFNESKGVVYPLAEGQFTDIYTVITYACLKQDLCKIVTDKSVTITRGTTVEGAVVRFLSAVCDMSVPSTVDSVPVFSYLFTEKYIVDESSYPVSENPSEDEVYYWVKLQAAQKAGYSVPATTKYKDLTQSQKDYVTYAYYASVLKTRYDVAVDPMRLKVAMNSGDSYNEVPRLVLETMLEDVSVSYSSDESGESLFNKTLNEGYFAIDNEFYTDIYNYRIYVPSDCEKVWITAFPVAGQLSDGDINKVSTYLNGALVKNNSTNYVAIPDSGATFTVKTKYADNNDTATYTFSVVKTNDAGSLNAAPSINISDPISEIKNEISNVISNAVDSAAEYTSATEGYTFNTVTTYAVEENTSSVLLNSSSDGFEAYPTDDSGSVLTTRDPLETEAQEETTASVIINVANTVKENPAVVAAPAGLIAVGASAGFIFYRRRKDDEGLFEGDAMEEEEILEEEEDFFEEEE